MTVFSTIHELLAGKPADAVAFVGSGCPSLTYGGLREHVERPVARLNRFGVGRNDRIAIVLPNGTEMASAFVAIAAGTTSAPLNPAYRADEFEFYLSDLKAKALVVERGSTSPALGVAAKLKIPVLEIVRASSDPAGVFELVPVKGGKTVAAPAAGGFAGPDDIALVLHTSGTTSRPKIVPLSQRNGARVLRHARGLAPDDQQPAAAAPAQARNRRRRRRTGSGDHGRERKAAGTERDRRGGDPRPERDQWLRKQSQGQRRGVHPRLVPHRRSGHAGCRGLSHDHRPAEGDHQPRR